MRLSEKPRQRKIIKLMMEDALTTSHYFALRGSLRQPISFPIISTFQPIILWISNQLIKICAFSIRSFLLDFIKSLINFNKPSSVAQSKTRHCARRREFNEFWSWGYVMIGWPWQGLIRGNLFCFNDKMFQLHEVTVFNRKVFSNWWTPYTLKCFTRPLKAQS